MYKQVVVYKISQPKKLNLCMALKTYESLFLTGCYEELGEKCFQPWNCVSCNAMLKYCRKKYHVE